MKWGLHPSRSQLMSWRCKMKAKKQLARRTQQCEGLHAGQKSYLPYSLAMEAAMSGKPDDHAGFNYTDGKDLVFRKKYSRLEYILDGGTWSNLNYLAQEQAR